MTKRFRPLHELPLFAMMAQHLAVLADEVQREVDKRSPQGGAEASIAGNGIRQGGDRTDSS